MKHGQKKHQKKGLKKNNVITYGKALAQVLSESEQVGNLPLYRVSRRAVEIFATTKWK